MKKVIELTEIASWLYRNSYSCKARFEIYDGTAGWHPKDEIDCVIFSPQTKKVIEFVSNEIEK